MKNFFSSCKGEKMNLGKFITTIKKIVYLLSRSINFVGIGFLCVLMLLVVVHILTRYILTFPIPGSVEIIELLMILVVFLGMAECAVNKGNIVVDLFVNLLPKQTQEIIGICISFLSIFIVSLIAWQNMVQVKLLWHSGHSSGALHIPHWPFAIIVALGWAVFDLVLVVHCFELIKKVLKK